MRSYFLSAPAYNHDLELALADIGAGEAILYVDDPDGFVDVTNNPEVLSNVYLVGTGQGQIELRGALHGYLIVSGPISSPLLPLFRTLDNDPRYVFVGRTTTLYANWFGITNVPDDDNHFKFQFAIGSASFSKRALVFSAGNYIVNDDVVLNYRNTPQLGYVQLVGLSRGSVLFKDSADNTDNLLRVNNSAGLQSQDARISGLRFESNRVDDQGSLLLFINNAGRVSIKNCGFSKYSTGVQLKGVSQVRLHQNQFSVFYKSGIQISADSAGTRTLSGLIASSNRVDCTGLVRQDNPGSGGAKAFHVTRFADLPSTTERSRRMVLKGMILTRSHSSGFSLNRVLRDYIVAHNISEKHLTGAEPIAIGGLAPDSSTDASAFGNEGFIVYGNHSIQAEGGGGSVLLSKQAKDVLVTANLNRRGGQGVYMGLEARPESRLSGSGFRST